MEQEKKLMMILRCPCDLLHTYISPRKSKKRKEPSEKAVCYFDFYDLIILVPYTFLAYFHLVLVGIIPSMSDKLNCPNKLLDLMPMLSKCQQKVDKYTAQFVTFFDKFEYWAERKGLSIEDMVLPFPLLKLSFC
mmetsp:Transcript_35645/g.45365  ORF Transcript_35645/g.45365 Transcript_35645/m.45365 type:complete len:134 (+) Transcript_35645:236-637(+)